MEISQILMGLVIVGGWYVSGHVGFLAEDPATLEEKFVATNSGRMESYSFTAPVAYLLELLMLWTDQSRLVTFGIAGVLGMIAGSTAIALLTRTFRWEGFTNREDLANHVVGGIIMGFGGVTALGCTIGQGLTGISTLAVGSILLSRPFTRARAPSNPWEYRFHVGNTLVVGLFQLAAIGVSFLLMPHIAYVILPMLISFSSVGLSHRIVKGAMEAMASRRAGQPAVQPGAGGK